MSVYRDMAYDAGARGEELDQLAQAIEEDAMRDFYSQQQEPEPDQIDLMDATELRAELRRVLAENRDLHEQVAALQSKEVCTRAHEDAVLEGCPYCRLEWHRAFVGTVSMALEHLDDDYDADLCFR